MRRFEFTMSGHFILDDEDIDMLVSSGVDVNDPVAVAGWFDGMDFLQYVENCEYTIIPHN